jgi:hypothetical protein
MYFIENFMHEMCVVIITFMISFIIIIRDNFIIVK